MICWSDRLVFNCDMLFDGQGDWCAATFDQFCFYYICQLRLKIVFFPTFRKCVGNKPDQSHIWVLAFIYSRIGFHLISWLLSWPLGKYEKYLLELDLISESGNYLERWMFEKLNPRALDYFFPAIKISKEDTLSTFSQR